MSFESIRESLSAKPRRTALMAVLVAVIALATWFMVSSMGRSSGYLPKGVYFAHEDTGELSVQPVGTMAPINDATGSPKLVRAILYTTDGGKTKITAYYEKLSDAVKAMYDKIPSGGAYDQRLVDNGVLVKLPEKDAPWVNAKSPEGALVKAKLPAGANECSLVLP